MGIIKPAKHQKKGVKLQFVSTYKLRQNPMKHKHIAFILAIMITGCTNTVEPPIQPAFEDIIQEYDNSDIVGYIHIIDTTINQPVLQNIDNEYYRNNNIYKEPDSNGSIFMDYRNTLSNKERNLVIYGYNEKEQDLFHDIRLYSDSKFCSTHKYISFDNLYKNETWEIFAFYETTTGFDHTQINFSSDNKFMNFIAQIQENSIYQTNIEIEPNDCILTLSTYSDSNNEQYVIHAKKIKSEHDITT